MSLNLDERNSQHGTTSAEGPVPERMHLSLQREWGCIARFWSHFEVIREKEQATFYCRTQAHVPHLLPFQRDLPPAKFEALWRALQASEPAHWAAEYGQEQGIFSTGPLCGTLSLAYTLDGQAFSRTVQFLEDHFDDDAQMQQLYAYLVEFEEASLEFEAGQREATA